MSNLGEEGHIYSALNVINLSSFQDVIGGTCKDMQTSGIHHILPKYNLRYYYIYDTKVSIQKWHVRSSKYYVRKKRKN